MADRTTMKAFPSRLVEGQQLDQPEFHALYEAMPRGTRAELIDGVVFMPSPAGPEHGEAAVPVIAWLSFYTENTPGVRAGDNITTILSGKGEPQPDGILRVLPEFGGQTWIEAGYIHGPPELVAEVSKATRYVDLGPKRREYERAGVLEYVVRAIDPDEIYWFALERGELLKRTVGDDGLYRSSAFPGLWLDPLALLSGDTRRLRAVVEQGCATPEHADFVARLAAQRGS